MRGVKLRYFASSLTKRMAGRGLRCPSCGAADGTVVSRKYMVTTLRRCGACRLLYRAPTSEAAESARYYNSAYRSGMTTDMPDMPALEELKRAGFAGTEKGFGRYIAIVRALGFGRGARILDYGCSWGYGAWQFQEAGFQAAGLEVCQARADFARNRMGVDVVTEHDDVAGRFDVIFSAHVLEHVPCVSAAIDWAFARLRPEGLLVSVTPNGSRAFRARQPRRWDRLWGYVHPNFLDAEYYAAKAAAMPYLLTTRLDDLAAIAAWGRARGQTRGELSGWELLAVCAR